MVEVYLGLGANQGNKAKTSARAVSLLGGYMEVDRQSALYETRPYGLHNQPNFLNGAVRVQTILEPWELRDFVLQPLIDIDPTLCHPETGVCVVELLAQIPLDERFILKKC